MWPPPCLAGSTPTASCTWLTRPIRRRRHPNPNPYPNPNPDADADPNPDADPDPDPDHDPNPDPNPNPNPNPNPDPKPADAVQAALRGALEGARRRLRARREQSPLRQLWPLRVLQAEALVSVSVGLGLGVGLTLTQTGCCRRRRGRLPPRGRGRRPSHHRPWTVLPWTPLQRERPEPSTG